MLNDRYLARPEMPNLDTHGYASLLSAPVVRPKLVIVEPDSIGFADGASHLLEERYRVTFAKDVRELFLLRDEAPFVVALVSDHLGSSQLVAAAYSVRRQRPDARILVLGQAAVMLEDHRYDDSIAHPCSQEALFASISKLSCDPWRQKAEGRPFIVQPLYAEQPGVRAEVPNYLEAPKNILARPA